LEKDLSQPNSFGERRYQITKQEKDISIQAANSTNYEDFFDEFCPNSISKSQRKHKYSVSIHPAVFTEESFLLYKRFKKFIFDKVYSHFYHK
jgi:hypothetical protein